MIPLWHKEAVFASPWEGKYSWSDASAFDPTVLLYNDTSLSTSKPVS
jgi:hypothetical protein